MKRWAILLLALSCLSFVLPTASADTSYIGFARVELYEVNVREEPNGNSKRVHRLMAGDHVFVLKEEKDRNGQAWYFINYKPRNGSNKTGWIRGDMLLLSRDIFTDVKKIAVSGNLIAALKNDGSVIAMGEQYPGGFNPDTIHWQGITDIAAGTCTVIGVSDDSRLVGTGNFAYNGYGDTPDVEQIYMRYGASIVIRKDSTVFASPEVTGIRYLPHNEGASALPSPSGITEFDAISITRGKLLDLYKSSGQEIGEWSGVKEVSSGAMHHVLLMQDGTVKAFGDNNYGVCDVSDWTDIIQVVCADYRTVGLKSDGTVLATGHNGYGECDVSGWRNIIQIECTNRFTVGLTSDGQVLVAGEARFDYDEEHYDLYRAKQEEMTAIISEGHMLDENYN